MCVCAHERRWWMRCWVSVGEGGGGEDAERVGGCVSVRDCVGIGIGVGVSVGVGVGVGVCVGVCVGVVAQPQQSK